MASTDLSALYLFDKKEWGVKNNYIYLYIIWLNSTKQDTCLHLCFRSNGHFAESPDAFCACTNKTTH